MDVELSNAKDFGLSHSSLAMILSIWLVSDQLWKAGSFIGRYMRGADPVDPF